jgi:hypothetical protein
MRKQGNHFCYSLLTSLSSQLLANELEFSVASMQYTMKSQSFQMPSSGLNRVLTTGVVLEDWLYVGTQAGELLVFSVSNRNLKAIIPVNITLSF